MRTLALRAEQHRHEPGGPFDWFEVFSASKRPDETDPRLLGRERPHHLRRRRRGLVLRPLLAVLRNHSGWKNSSTDRDRPSDQTYDSPIGRCGHRVAEQQYLIRADFWRSDDPRCANSGPISRGAAPCIHRGRVVPVLKCAGLIAVFERVAKETWLLPLYEFDTSSGGGAAYLREVLDIDSQHSEPFTSQGFNRVDRNAVLTELGESRMRKWENLRRVWIR